MSISTAKRVLYQHNLKGLLARKKPLLQNRHKKARLRFANAHGDKDRTFWRNVLWSDETKIELFGHNDHHYVWRKKADACKPKNTIATVVHFTQLMASETSQDISQEVKAWSQMGLPNGQ